MNLENFKNCKRRFAMLPIVLMAISAISSIPLGHATLGDSTVSACPNSLSIKRGTSITCVLALPIGFDCAGGVIITPVGKFSPKLAATCLVGPGQFAFNLTITARHSPKGDGTYMITASEQGILGTTVTLTVTKK